MEIKSAKGIGYNWNHFNQLQNTFEIMVKDEDLKYPKSLVTQAVKWVKEECENRKIDFSAYPFVEITQFDGVCYQVNFYQKEECINECLSLYEIYFDSRSRKIMQACFGI